MPAVCSVAAVSIRKTEHMFDPWLSKASLSFDWVAVSDEGSAGRMQSSLQLLIIEVWEGSIGCMSREIQAEISNLNMRKCTFNAASPNQERERKIQPEKPGLSRSCAKLPCASGFQSLGAVRQWTKIKINHTVQRRTLSDQPKCSYHNLKKGKLSVVANETRETVIRD